MWKKFAIFGLMVTVWALGAVTSLVVEHVVLPQVGVDSYSVSSDGGALVFTDGSGYSHTMAAAEDGQIFSEPRTLEGSITVFRVTGAAGQEGSGVVTASGAVLILEDIPAEAINLAIGFEADGRIYGEGGY